MLLLPVAWAQGWTDKRRLWTASERGRTARNRQAASRRVPTGSVPAARERAVCRPSGRKVNVPASPYSPCGGSFLPWKDVAHAADLCDDRNLRLDHLPVGAIRVNSTGGRPSIAIETQHAVVPLPSHGEAASGRVGTLRRNCSVERGRLDVPTRRTGPFDGGYSSGSSFQHPLRLPRGRLSNLAGAPVSGLHFRLGSGYKFLLVDFGRAVEVAPGGEGERH